MSTALILLKLLLVVLATVIPGGAQNLRCDVITDIIVSSARVGINLSEQSHVCLRCLNANGETSIQTIWVLSDGNIVSDTVNQNPAVGEYDNGVLVLLPGVLGNGSAGEYGPISCFSGSNIQPEYQYVDITLFSTVLLPPSIRGFPIRRVEEGSGPAFLICSNPNSPEVTTSSLQWFRAGELGRSLSSSSRLVFAAPILRQAAGQYECRVTSIINGKTASAIGELIVEYAPIITVAENESISLFLNSTLSLTCLYDAVPIPSVQWLLNGTQLDSTSPRVTVTTTNGSSLLIIDHLQQQDEGIYSCIFENVRGRSITNVTTLFILTSTIPASTSSTLTTPATSTSAPGSGDVLPTLSPQEEICVSEMTLIDMVAMDCAFNLRTSEAICRNTKCFGVFDALYARCGRSEFVNEVCAILLGGSPSPTDSASSTFATVPPTTSTSAPGSGEQLPTLSPDEAQCVIQMVLDSSNISECLQNVENICTDLRCRELLVAVYARCGREELIERACDISGSTTSTIESTLPTLPTTSPTSSTATIFTTPVTGTSAPGSGDELPTLSPQEEMCISEMILTDMVVISCATNAERAEDICKDARCFDAFDQLYTRCGRSEIVEEVCAALLDGSGFVPSTTDPILPTSSPSVFTTPGSFVSSTSAPNSGELPTLSPNEIECISRMIVDDQTIIACVNSLQTIENICRDAECRGLLDSLYTRCGRSDLIEFACSFFSSGSGFITPTMDTIDNSVIKFEKTRVEVAEDIGLNDFAVRICLTISNLTSSRSVTIDSFPGTATPGEDYEFFRRVLNVSMDTRTCVAVIILEDQQTESDENFFLSIQETGETVEVVILNDDDDTSFNFTANTPMVSGDTVAFSLSLGTGVARAVCAVIHGDYVVAEADCTSGEVQFSSIRRRFVELTPKIAIIGRKNETPIVTMDTARNFRLTAGSRRRCSVHLINKGVTTAHQVNGITVKSVEWGLAAPVDVLPSNITFMCSLDGKQAFECTSPFTVESSRASSLTVVPPRNSGGCIRGIDRTFRLN